MHENLEDIDLATCSRRARRWAMGLVCLLAANGSLVALALAGFGPAQPRPVTAARPMSTPLPAPKQAAAPLGTVPVPDKPEMPAAHKLPAAATAKQQPSEPPVLPSVSVDSLILINPAATGGEVHFAVDGVVHRLNAGEYLEISGRRQRRVEFHRGDDFGYASQETGAGALAFAVGEMGWTLSPLDADAARELLSTCRAKSR